MKNFFDFNGYKLTMSPHWRKATSTFALAAACSSCASYNGDRGSPPHLDKIVVRETTQKYDYYYPSFYFTDPDGDAVLIHRKLISVEGSLPNFNTTSQLRIDSQLQKTGAVWVGGWYCGPNPVTANVEAYLTDRAGNKSNTLSYTVVCRGANALPR